MKLFLFILNFFIAASQTPDSLKYTAIVGGDIHTVTKGVVKDGIILIKGEKIEKIGVNIDIPEGAVIIDAKDMFIMPGIIAATSVVGLPRTFSGLQERGNLNPHMKISDALNPYDRLFKFALAGGITTCFLTPGERQLISGQACIIKLLYGQSDKLMIKDPAAVKMGVPFTGLTPKGMQDLKDLLNQAKDYKKSFDEYEEKKAQGEKAVKPRENPRLDPLLKLLKGEIPARAFCSRKSEILFFLQLADEYNIRMVLDDASEGYLIANEIAARGISAVVYPRSGIPENPDFPGQSGGKLSAPKIMNKGGIKIAIRTGFLGIDFFTMGAMGNDIMTLSLEAAFAVRGGLDKDKALEAITINAAEILEIDDRVGSLEEGKDADIIILDGHPFYYKARVQKALINGKVVYIKEGL